MCLSVGRRHKESDVYTYLLVHAESKGWPSVFTSQSVVHPLSARVRDAVVGQVAVVKHRRAIADGRSALAVPDGRARSSIASGLEERWRAFSSLSCAGVCGRCSKEETSRSRPEGRPTCETPRARGNACGRGQAGRRRRRPACQARKGRGRVRCPDTPSPPPHTHQWAASSVAPTPSTPSLPLPAPSGLSPDMRLMCCFCDGYGDQRVRSTTSTCRLARMR